MGWKEGYRTGPKELSPGKVLESHKESVDRKTRERTCLVNKLYSHYYQMLDLALHFS